jgi:hypothetical protein
LRSHAPGALPSFKTTSSPELDALLARFRSNVFLPAHLPQAQRDIIYRPKNHHLLTAEEPATVAIGEEVLQMKPLNRLDDEPGVRAAIAKILTLMSSPRDWENLAPFLIGLRNSQRILKDSQVEKIVRVACLKGRETAIMECLRQVDRTGWGLWHLSIAKQMMWRAMGRAMDGDWEEQALDKGLELADALWIMMQDPKHADPIKRHRNSTYSPEVVGVMVQLHAAKAVMFRGGEDTRGLVNEYTQRLLALWEKLEFSGEGLELYDARENLLAWAPIWHGLKLVQKVSGVGPVKILLNLRIDEVESAIHIAQDALLDQGKGSTARGLNLYEKLSRVSS